jgi:hypothetical protein
MAGDTRDGGTILSEIEAEFRRACEAQRDFLAWYGSRYEVPFTESLHRYGGMIEASAPWAASYRLVSTKFPEYVDRLHALLLPIQHEVFGSDPSPGLQQSVDQFRVARGHWRR